MLKLLIICNQPETAAQYRLAAEKLGADCKVAADVREMKQIMRGRPFHGLILDVLTAVRASLNDKITLQEVSEIYPTLRVRWDAEAGRIRGIFIGRRIDKRNPLGDFIDTYCSTRPARICRENPRYRIHFNVLLSKEQTCCETTAERVVSLDISRGGCFFISTRDWQDTGAAWVRFLDISDPTPVKVTIRRRCHWGKTLQMPGIGVEFCEIDAKQLEEICQHIDKSR
jgi:hypothetical protein